jgi:peptide/nickel transport system substrate-binding protein
MLGKVCWSFLSITTVALLLLVSCAPGATSSQTAMPTTTATATTAAPTPKTSAVTTTASIDRPKYGGILTLMQTADITVFSPIAVSGGKSLDPVLFGLVYEQLLQGNWLMGPAGTNEGLFNYGTNNSVMRWEEVTGQLVESWEVPQLGVWKLHIRPGVHFGLDPNSDASKLANGREITADDVVWSMNYIFTTPGSSIIPSQPNFAKNASAEKTGPWEVTLKTPVDPGVAYLWVLGGGTGSSAIFAKEVQLKYGQTNDWRQTVGQGPYMLTDFVPGSSATFVRNPNYWQKNPIGPGKGDQLPYPDGLKVLIVPDFSTQTAGLRAGLADRLEMVPYEDAQSLIKSGHNFQSQKYMSAGTVIAMRVDKQNLPFKDKRVRQALMLATDYSSFKNDYFVGQAEILVTPAAQVKGTERLYYPIEQLPQQVGDLFKYNPDKAKSLLKEAGFPNGFKTTMVVQNLPSMIDSATVFKSMWGKVGVDVEIQPKESGVYSAIGRNYDEMLQVVMPTDWTNLASRFGWTCCRSNSIGHFDDNLDEPAIETAFAAVQKAVTIDFPKADKIMHDLIPTFLDQSYWIPRPEPYSYRIWQSWLKNYQGQSHPRYWIAYPWIDQELKRQLR